ncbi:MAG: BREX-3 system phosphatase PglZ, partial [Bacteroidetes bacterium]|nr:BREX-3 system phosphatase PglZ [Bacteroidota bacterium]
EKGFLSSLITDLLDLDFDVWLTSDHGNIECQGKGRPAEGVIAETRGERVRVYPTQELRSQVSESFSFAHKWEPIGLPSEYFPLVISDREAFVTKGETIVGHGGISLEEVIVPLIKFSKSDI